MVTTKWNNDFLPQRTKGALEISLTQGKLWVSMKTKLRSNVNKCLGKQGQSGPQNLRDVAEGGGGGNFEYFTGKK